MNETQLTVVRDPVPVPAELSPEQVITQVEKIQTLMKAVMKDGEHFGIIPGTPKPTLLKAGAEKLCLMFRLDPQYETRETRDGLHLTVAATCTLYHIPTSNRMGSGMGSCSTKESKYAYRRQGGSRVPNPDIADQYNTVLKMACKRALVAAVLNVTAASDIFTQDIEDLGAPHNGKDEAFEAVKASVPPPHSAGPTISEAQGKRMYALAKGDRVLLEMILKRRGLKHSREVLKSEYEAICAEVAGGLDALEGKQEGESEDIPF